jgi:hypothetical protein
MSGIIGHTMYAILGGKSARERGLPIVPILDHHAASYHCGAYLGCDIQTMPEAICADTGQEVGYGTAPLKISPITGGKVKPWSLTHGEKSFRPREIHRLFYGRAHLVFGWRSEDREHTVPWDHLVDYCVAVIRDAKDIHQASDRTLAYLFGWMAHIVGDSLIKSVQPGVDLQLHGGKYTPTNRPIQDLVTFHEIGRKELKLNWQTILADLAKTPVEKIQLHYMRVAKARGELGSQFTNAWQPEHEELLRTVLLENRRYQLIRNPRILKQLELSRTKTGWDCRPELTRQSLGLHYPDMIKLAEKADFRHALWQIGDAIGKLFADVMERVPDIRTH